MASEILHEKGKLLALLGSTLFAGLPLIAVAFAVAAQSSNSIALDTAAYNIAVCTSENWIEPLLTTDPGLRITIQ